MAIESIVLSGHLHGVTSVTPTPCGRFAISGGDDNVLRAHSLTSGELLASTTKAHGSIAWKIRAAPSKEFIVTCDCGNEKLFKVWESEKLTLVQTVEGHEVSEKKEQQCSNKHNTNQASFNFFSITKS